MPNAAMMLAQAYYDYASTGLFGSSIPVILEEMRDAMADTLEAALDPIVGLPVTAAGAYAAAVNVFWTGVPVAGGTGVGVTTGCPGAASLVASMAAVFANPANTYASAASGMASAVNTATTTVICNLTLPPAGPVPTPLS